MAKEGYTENGHRARADGDQRAAREAVLSIPLFPELERRLIAKFGPTAEAIMLHQLCYWYRKPKLQGRWTLYKTADEWREERGLNRKQVDRGRARLKPFGVVEEKKGPYKRIHYRIDWVRLAELLSIPLKGSQKDAPDEDRVLLPPLKGEQKPITPPSGVEESIAPPQTDAPAHIYAENPANRGGQSNAVEEAGEFIQDNSSYQEGGDGSSSRTAVTRDEDRFSPQRDVEAHPDHDTQPRSLTPQQKKSAREGGEADPQPDNDASRSGPVSLPVEPDPGRVRMAAEVLDRLVTDWPAYEQDVVRRDWGQILFIMEHYDYSDEQFTDAELLRAAELLEAGSLAPEKVAV